MSCASETGCLTLIWKIENFSILLSNDATYPETSIVLPTLKVKTTEGIELCMVEAALRGDDFQLHLWSGIYEYPFKQCEVSLLSANDEILLKTKELSFEKKLFVVDESLKQSMFPQGTLTLCLRVWKEEIINTKHHIRTILYQKKVSWYIIMMEFPACFKYFDIDNLMCRMIFDRKSKCIYNIHIEAITSTRGIPAIYKCKFSFREKTNKWCSNNDEGRCSSYKNKCILNIKVPPKFCNIDNLQIEVDCILAFHEQFEVIKEPLNQLHTDFWRMYKEGIHSDATLKVKEKSYRVHRNILAARSSVFRAMFEKNQMTEARSGIVAIDDIDYKTIEQLLYFMYGDAVEDLEWEEASALYYAADKYAIHPLKEKCLCLLKQRLTTSNVCEALFLADAHSDEKLMRFVVDFICAVEDLEWEEASALYYAVNKYAIQPLKEKCFGMLKQHLTVSNVCKALVLADAHSDEKLLWFVVDFICDHKEVVCSKEWAELQESNPVLTSKIASELFLKTV